MNASIYLMLSLCGKYYPISSYLEIRGNNKNHITKTDNITHDYFTLPYHLGLLKHIQIYF